MATGKYVSYLRVSTEQQGRSGLGLEAQRSSVAEYLNGGQWALVGEFVEVESGRKSDRPELQMALAACRIHKATLVVAKLDRLSRNAHFLLGLKESGVDFVCVDMPSANRLTVGIMAMVAEEEARMISARTKAALGAAKVRGVRLGRPNLTNSARMEGTIQSAEVRANRARQRSSDLAPIMEQARSSGSTSAAALARFLNKAGIPAARGGKWGAVQVLRVLRPKAQ
jgi:DNA invertase Pin-like site-specific DNA recombinase